MKFALAFQKIRPVFGFHQFTYNFPVGQPGLLQSFLITLTAIALLWIIAPCGMPLFFFPIALGH